MKTWRNLNRAGREAWRRLARCDLRLLCWLGASLVCGVGFLAAQSSLTDLSASGDSTQVHNETNNAGSLVGPWFFERALEPVGPLSGESPAEAAALAAALELAAGQGADEVAELLDVFVEEHPTSVWTPSLRASLGSYHRQAGRHAKAFEHWAWTWDFTRHYTNGPGKAVADYALAQCTDMVRELEADSAPGRAARLSSLWQVVYGAQSSGSAETNGVQVLDSTGWNADAASGAAAKPSARPTPSGALPHLVFATLRRPAQAPADSGLGATTQSVETEVPKSSMTLSGSSACPGWDYANAKDNLNSDPGWHNATYTSTNEFLRVDLGTSRTISRVAYLPRAMASHTPDGSWNGVFRNFEIYVTDDASDLLANWGERVAWGEWLWPNLQERKDVALTTPKAGRYVYFRRVSAWGWYSETHPGYASANEIWVYELGSSGGATETEVPKSGITLTGSSATTGWDYANAKDTLSSDPGWHNTTYTSTNEFLRADLGTARVISRVAYLPRVMASLIPDGSWNGVFREYKIYVTDDASGNPANWGEPVTSGIWNWPNLQERKDVTFVPKAGRYVYFRRVSAWGWYSESQPGYASANEIWIYEQSGAGPDPAILTHPLSQTVTGWNPVTFTVVASGTAPLSYYWRSNSVDIAGATASSYTIAHVEPTHAAAYSVRVSNSIGSAYSSGAMLTVTQPDGDSDTLPDWWESKHFDSPSAYDGSADPDQDTLTNLEEYLNGTNPTVFNLRLGIFEPKPGANIP